MTCPAPRVKSYLHPLSHCRIKQQRNLRPGRWPSRKPWSLAVSPPCPGRTRCRRRRNGKGVIPLQKAAPTRSCLPHYWRVITPGMSPWWMTVSSSMTDMVIEEEREESMDTVPLKEKSMLEDFEARDPDDHCSHTSEESTNQNPPHDSNPNEDELLGLVTDISIPRGHSNDSIALIVSPGEDDL